MKRIRWQVDEEDQVGSLPDGFSTLVTALEAQVDDVKLDFVQQDLINEERKKLFSVSGSLEAGASALATRHGREKKWTKKKKANCINFGKVGHFAPECRILQSHRRKKRRPDLCSVRKEAQISGKICLMKKKLGNKPLFEGTILSN